MEKISVQANVKADIMKIWNYYTNPEHITHWNFALDDWHCPNAMNDIRVGGRLVARMEAKDASEGFYFVGTYTDILFGKRMAYIMTDERHVIVEFNNIGTTNTDVIVTFDIENENPPEMQREGWQSILDNFKKYVESH